MMEVRARVNPHLNVYLYGIPSALPPVPLPNGQPRPVHDPKSYPLAPLHALSLDPKLHCFHPLQLALLINVFIQLAEYDEGEYVCGKKAIAAS